MKTPEEIKKGLIEAIEETSWVVEGGDAHDLIDACEMAHASMADAIAYIQQLEAQVPRWISVEERLPEPLKYVLAIHMYDDDSFEPCIAYYRAGNWFAGTYKTGEVTHWMTMPEPPKEGGTNEDDQQSAATRKAT